MKLAERITNSLLNEGFITEQEKDVVSFGLDNLGSNLYGILVTVAVGICFRHIGAAVCLWLFLFPLRKNAGGYHASTRIRCLIMSTVILIVSFFLYVVLFHTISFYLETVMLSSVIVYIEAPMGNPVKPLDEREHNIFQRRSRCVLTVEVIAFAFSLYLNCFMISASISMALFSVSSSLLLGKYSFRSKMKMAKNC